MTPEPITVPPETPVREVVALMAERRIRHVPVLDDEGDLCGIASQRDLLCPPGGQGVAVGDVMVRSVDTVTADACPGAAARHMLSSKRSSLPVVDAKGGLIGILTEADFLRFVVRQSPPCSRGGVSLGDA